MSTTITVTILATRTREILAATTPAMGRAAGWSHARHVEASVRRHAPTVAGDAYDRLVRVATARMEALSQPDAYGTRPTAAGMHRTVSRWAAEGPVAARRAA